MKRALPLLRRLLPTKLAARFVAAIGRVELLARPGLRRRFEAAVEVGRDQLGADWDVSKVARRLAANQVRWRVRDLLLDGLDDHRALATFRVRGLEHLDAAEAEGRGVLLLGNHYGAHLLPAHWMLRVGRPLRLYMERPKSVSKHLSRGLGFDVDGPLGQRKFFISRKAATAEAAASILRAARALKAGNAVLIASDVRWEGTGTAPGTFLGRTWNFSTTWASLAALTGAPIVPVFCRMAADGGFDLEFLEAFRVPPKGDRNGSASVYVARALRELERWVEADPANSNDYLFWSGPLDTSAVAGRSRKRPAAPGRSAA